MTSPLSLNPFVEKSLEWKNPAESKMMSCSFAYRRKGIRYGDMHGK
jgi:hypothetical protein